MTVMTVVSRSVLVDGTTGGGVVVETGATVVGTGAEEVVNGQ